MAPIKLFQTLHRFPPTPKPLSTLSHTPLFHTSPKNPQTPNQSQSHYRKQFSVASLLQRHGFPSSKLQVFLNKNHFLLNANPTDIQKSLGILLSFKIPQRDLIFLVSNCPGVLDFEFLKKWDVSFSQFGDLGLSPLVIKSVLEYSRRFGTDPDGLDECLRVLKGLGLSDGTVGRILEGFPGVISVKESEIQRQVEFLIKIGITIDGVDRVFYLFPELIGFGIERKLMPLLDEFEGLGFSKELIRKEILRNPRILGMELGELSRCLDLLTSLKCREPIRLEIFGDGAFRAGYEVKLRVDCLCKHGMIRREAFKVLWKEPRVIIYDVHDIEKKIDYLINTMGFGIGCLVDVPKYLGVSFEKQIVPRYSVIEHLHAKGALGDEVRLDDMIRLSRLRFYNMFVKPYPECEMLYGRFSGDVRGKHGHPVGLWKLFKPKKPQETKQDAENVKSFMVPLLRG